jgi:hypothetical protein
MQQNELDQNDAAGFRVVSVLKSFDLDRDALFGLYTGIADRCRRTWDAGTPDSSSVVSALSSPLES